MGALERLYLASPAPLQDTLVSAYGLVLCWRRCGPGHQARVRAVAAWEGLSRGELRAREGALIARTVGQAARRVPFYRDLFRQARLDPDRIDSRERLAALPLLDKASVRRHPERFLAEGVAAPHAIHTSGTSGAPLTVRCTGDALRWNYAHFYRLRERLGIGFRDRCATFAGRVLLNATAGAPPFWRFNAATNSLLFSTYHMAPANLPSYVERLARFSPALIDSYPSALGLLAAGVREAGVRVRPHAIITSSETLAAALRAEAEELFGCPVTDHYGSAEMVAWIVQCRYGTYHPWPGYGVAEVLVDGRAARPGETGELVCTGHLNAAMPLLRYRTGDLAVAGGECRCGLPFDSILRIEGRMEDLIITPDGRRVGRLDPVFKGAGDDAFCEAQIVQERPDRVVLHYVRGSRWSEEALEQVRHALALRLGPSVSIGTREEPFLPRGPNGKLRAVVSQVKPDAGFHSVTHR
jgi:phenylacetate-CoA ligase